MKRRADRNAGRTYFVRWTRCCLIFCGMLSLLLCLSACSRDTPAKPLASANSPDAQWVAGLPCRAPCWENILPGRTSVTEAATLLAHNPAVATVTSQAGIAWTWQATHRPGGEIRIDHGHVQSITPFYDSAFRLGDIIQTYGEPSYVNAKAFHNPDGSDITYSVQIEWQAAGFDVRAGNAASQPLVLGPDLQVEDPTFFVPWGDSPRV